MVPRGPELERQERVELFPVVVAPRGVLGEEPLDRLGAEEAATADHVRRARVAEQRGELAAEPAPERHPEPLLRPAEGLAREETGDRALEEVLGREPAELE